MVMATGIIAIAASQLGLRALANALFTLNIGTYALLWLLYLGRLLWLVAIVLWLALTYGILAAFTIREKKPTLDRGIHGGWLLMVVATQSIAVLSALLAARDATPYRAELDFLALSNVALWRHALYLGDDTHRLSLAFFPGRPGRPDTAVLDQHGHHGDLDPRRAGPEFAAPLRRTSLLFSPPTPIGHEGR